MGPPSHPASATAPLYNPRSPVMSITDQVPMRHPRPLTAAELYAECEKEQEAVVRRYYTQVLIASTNGQRRSIVSHASLLLYVLSLRLLPATRPSRQPRLACPCSLSTSQTPIQPTR